MNKVVFLLILTLLGCKNNKTNEVAENTYSSIDSIQREMTINKELNVNATIINSKGDSLQLKDIISDDVVFVRYSNYACYECIVFAMDQIFEHGKTSNCIILTSEMSKRDLHVYEQRNKGIKIYLIEELNIDFDEGLTPYFFYLKQEKVDNFLIPRKEDIDLIHKFFENI